MALAPIARSLIFLEGGKSIVPDTALTAPGVGETPTPAPTPTVYLSAAVAQSEGNSGTTIFTFTVARSNLTGAIVVPWTFVAGDTSPSDFVGGNYPAGGSVNIPNGVASGSFTIAVAGDASDEADEAFSVVISAPGGYALGTPSTATGTILNDDSSLIAPNGELSNAYFGSVSWPTTDDEPWGDPVLVAPYEPGVTPGVNVISTAGTNAAPVFDEHVDVYIDGRTLMRPAAATQGAAAAINSFEFGENPAGRTYQPSGGRRAVWRNFNGGAFKQQYLAASEIISMHGHKSDHTNGVDGDNLYNGGSTPITATVFITGDLATISGVPASSTLKERMTIVGASGRTLLLKQLSGTTGKDGIYRVNVSQNLASGPYRIGFRPGVQVQGCIGLGLKGTDRSHHRIPGDLNSGENNLVADSITMTGANQVTVVLPSDFPGLTKAFASFTASIDMEDIDPGAGTSIKPVLNVSAVAGGTALGVGQKIPTSGVESGTYIASQISGTPGGAGKYLLDSGTQTVTSRAMTAIPWEFTIGGSQITGSSSPSVLNTGFEGTFEFVSAQYNVPSAGKITLVLAFGGEHQTKPTIGQTAIAGALIWAKASIPAEHADGHQVDKDKLCAFLRRANNSFSGNYQPGGIARNSATDLFDIDIYKEDWETDITLTFAQDAGSYTGWFTTSAIQAGVTTRFKDVVARLRPGQAIAGRVTPGTGAGYTGGIATTALYNGLTVAALKWDLMQRPGFLGIIKQATSIVKHYGFSGQTTAHNGINFQAAGVSGSAVAQQSHLTAITTEDRAGIIQPTTLEVPCDLGAQGHICWTDVLETLPPSPDGETHILDMTISTGVGISPNSIARKGPQLLRGSAMLPIVAADTVFTDAITINYNLRSNPALVLQAKRNLKVTPGQFGTFSGAFAKSYEGSQEAAVATSTATATFNITPAPAVDRIEVLVMNVIAGAARNPTAVTIGGVAAQLVGAVAYADTSGTGGTSYDYTYIYQARVPTGTTAAISATFSGTVQDVGMHLYSIVGGLRAYGTDGTDGLLMIYDYATSIAAINADIPAVTLGTAEGGCVIGGALWSSASSSGHRMSAAGSAATVAGNRSIAGDITGTSIAFSNATVDGSILDMATSGSPRSTMAFVAFAPHA